MNFIIAFFAMAMALAAADAGAVGSVADLSVFDRAENRVLPVYFHEGRYYVAGKPGNEYQLNLRNSQPGDIMAVVAVDGVNAVTGETADWSQTGYVFSPGANYSIKGWRKSLQRVARFYFTELDNSYAARTGRPDNVGVIGVAIFRSKREEVTGALREPMRSYDRADARGPAEAAAGSGVEQSRRMPAAPPALEKNLGTGHGASENAPVQTTRFERASTTPDEVITLYYDSYRNLLAQGVIRAPSIARPQAFPGRFVPDPR
jgi:hypothetical protein